MFYFWYRFVLENFDLTFGLMHTAGNHGFPAVFPYTEMYTLPK